MKHAIHCETEEEARRVLEIAHDAGLKWHSGVILLDEPKLRVLLVYRDAVCLYVASETGVSHSDIQYAKDHGYTIVKAQDFIEADRKSKEA